MKFLGFLNILLFLIPVNASFKPSVYQGSLTTKQPVIAKKVFISTIASISNEFVELPTYFNESLIMYAGWDHPTADNALARRWDNAQVLVFRGIAHRPELGPDSLALIACHELGHLYAGAPLKQLGNYISAEGQADYFATKYCLRRALSSISIKNIETRAFKAIEQVGAFLANNWGHEHPSSQTPDTSITKKTKLSYPSPQCRFDTYLAGLSGLPRPSCWFKAFQ